MKPGLYERLVERARYACEVCCIRLPPGECDHFFGRAKAEETEATCWMLCPQCHFAKTRCYPDASAWLRKFAEHCDRHGYIESAERARARLDFVDTRRALGSALGQRR